MTVVYRRRMTAVHCRRVTVGFAAAGVANEDGAEYVVYDTQQVLAIALMCDDDYDVYAP